MDIRQAGFWPEIESIFPQRAYDVHSVDEYGGGGRLCRYHHFVDRLETAARRARRHGKYALLILVEFRSTEKQHDSDHAQPRLELLMCRTGSCLRSCDSLCDLGNSRFALLLDDIREPSVAPMVLEKLNTTLIEPFKTNSQVSRFQASFGASLFPVEGVPVSRVWLDTEVALARAVAAGVGGYNISPIITGQDAMERFELSKDLYKAYRNNEFELGYQPIIDLAENRVCAFEGLLRWRHPTRGCLSPDAFLPLLEESGLIVPVGERLLKQGCQLAQGLFNEGHEPLRVCINISARQLTDSGFLLSVFDALYETGLEASSLQLEFSEPVVNRQLGALQRILPELKNAGVQLAIDHFGAGDAPLLELVRLPVNLIKLDYCLVSQLVEDHASQVITSGAMALAGAAGMAVAAVGVEQRVQASVLEKTRCREAQGCYYSQPLSAPEMGAMLSA